ILRLGKYAEPLHRLVSKTKPNSGHRVCVSRRKGEVRSLRTLDSYSDRTRQPEGPFQVVLQSSSIGFGIVCFGYCVNLCLGLCRGRSLHGGFRNGCGRRGFGPLRVPVTNKKTANKNRRRSQKEHGGSTINVHGRLSAER